MTDHIKPYRPSNGSEGDWFTSKFCSNCFHGKYEHTGDVNDKPCVIIDASFCGYAKEWIYDEQMKPGCTAFVKWDWNQDDDGNWNDPPPEPIDDPNQLCMPFIFDEIGIEKTPAKTLTHAI